MKTRDIAIIILNYMSWKETLKEVSMCHDFLCVDYQDIIVIDNASPNESGDELEKASFEKFVFLKAKENKGYAAGNNIGLKHARSNGYKYALVLNNDIIIDNSELLAFMMKVFLKDPIVAVVNPDIYSPEGYLYNRDAKKPSFFDLTIGMLAYKRIGRKLDDMGGYGYVYRPQGCCMMLDLEKVREVDYFDENTFLYYEEFILAERLARSGYKCACANSVSVIHNHSQTVNSSIQRKRLVKIKNDSYKYYLKNYRFFSRTMTQICMFFHQIKLMCLK